MPRAHPRGNALLLAQAALIAFTLPAVLVSAFPIPARASQTRFGIEYFLWHCLTRGRPVYDISKYLTGQQQLGPVPSFHWWGKPEAGYYCLSRDDNLLRQHAVELADAGIDFVFVDFSNHAHASYRRVRLEYLDPLDRLLAVWARTPRAPKVVPFVPVTARGNLYRVIARRLERYPELAFHFDGKPLFLIVANARFPVDPMKRAALDRGFTTRLMWDDSSPPGVWMFISRCRPGFLRARAMVPCDQRVARRAGRVEQVSVAAAFQRDFMSDIGTAVPRFHGRTFLQQMRRLDDFRIRTVPIVTILGWNQWISQRICVRPVLSPDPSCAPGSSLLIGRNPVFTDLYDEEYSTDFEPGGTDGDAYYRLLACEIRRRKSGDHNEPTCPLLGTTSPH